MAEIHPTAVVHEGTVLGDGVRVLERVYLHPVRSELAHAPHAAEEADVAGEIVEGERFSRPYGPGAHSRASQRTNLRLRRHSHISIQGTRTFTALGLSFDAG
mgnify:CR=1 FL=1